MMVVNREEEKDYLFLLKHWHQLKGNKTNKEKTVSEVTPKGRPSQEATSAASAFLACVVSFRSEGSWLA